MVPQWVRLQLALGPVQAQVRVVAAMEVAVLLSPAGAGVVAGRSLTGKVFLWWRPVAACLAGEDLQEGEQVVRTHVGGGDGISAIWVPLPLRLSYLQRHT